MLDLFSGKWLSSGCPAWTPLHLHLNLLSTGAWNKCFLPDFSKACTLAQTVHLMLGLKNCNPKHARPPAFQILPWTWTPGLMRIFYQKNKNFSLNSFKLQPMPFNNKFYFQNPLHLLGWTHHYTCYKSWGPHFFIQQLIWETCLKFIEIFVTIDIPFYEINWKTLLRTIYIRVIYILSPVFKALC